MIDQPKEFDDPAFKAAVHRAMGNEHAPATLHKRIAAALAADQLAIAAASDLTPSKAVSTARAGSGSRSLGRWRELLQPRTLAIAAVALIAVGVAAVQIVSFFDLGWPGSAPNFASAGPVSFPSSFSASVVKVHDNCAKAADHRQIPGEDPLALRDRLSQLEGIPVSAINPGDGWTFKGAGLCTVEATRAAHLLYVRGTESVSVFSLPAPASCHESAYEQVESGHPLAGFTFNGALYCVVGSDSTGQFTLPELAPMIAKVRASMGITADCGSPDSPPAVQHASAAKSGQN